MVEKLLSFFGAVTYAASILLLLHEIGIEFGSWKFFALYLGLTIPIPLIVTGMHFQFA